MTIPLFRPALVVAIASVALAGCSTIGDLLSGDKVDYRSATNRSSGLEVPPDLTQLSRDSRFQQPASGSVSASTFQAAGAASAPIAALPAVAPAAVGEYRIQKLGNERWLATSLAPEVVFPQVRAFWKDNGFNLVQDRAEAGVLETDWAENRARLPNDIVRGTIGKIFDSVFSTGELDKYRTRIERTPSGGSDIYITHRGLAEVYVGQRTDSTTWQTRPPEPALEAEFLARLMVKLGAPQEQARLAVQTSASGPAGGPPRARTVAGRAGPTLQVDDGFDRAWRRVGLALDRSGFTVEDRDRSQGLYFVRYVNPAYAGREEPGFLARMLRFGRKPASDEGSGALRYRVKVTEEAAAQSTVAVLDTEGRPATGDSGQRIAALLLDDLK